MNDPGKAEGWDEKSFTEKLWTFDEQTLIQRFIATTPNRDSGDAHTAITILQAKATIASREAADAAKEAARQSERVANSTKWLAWATATMALATVALVVLTALKS